MPARACADVLFADQPLPPDSNPTLAQLKVRLPPPHAPSPPPRPPPSPATRSAELGGDCEQSYVGLLYGYLYTDGDLSRVRRGQPATPAEAPDGRLGGVLGGRENDRAQYEEYEQAVLRDLAAVYNVLTVPALENAPSPRHDEHAHTLRSEYREYRAEALDAFELSVAVRGSLRRIHPPPGGDEPNSRLASEWDKLTLSEAVGAAAAGELGAAVDTVEIVVTSKVNSRLARHYAQKAATGRNEGRMNLPGTAGLTGRSRQRPLLSRCYYGRALCMMTEADAATSLRAARETLKRRATAGGQTAHSAEETLRCLRYADVGSAPQLAFFSDGGLPDALPEAVTTRYAVAERVFVEQLGLPEGSTLIDPQRERDSDLERLCEQLVRRYEFAAVRRESRPPLRPAALATSHLPGACAELGVPDRDHFLVGLSLGLAITWVAPSLQALLISIVAGCLALVLAAVFLDRTLMPLPAWLCRREGADGDRAVDQGLSALCCGARLRAAGPLSAALKFVPEPLTDTRAMLVWVSQLLGVSLGGLLAALLAAAGTLAESGGSAAAFAQRFAYAAT